MIFSHIQTSSSREAGLRGLPQGSSGATFPILQTRTYLERLPTFLGKQHDGDIDGKIRRSGYMIDVILVQDRIFREKCLLWTDEGNDLGEVC